MDEVQWVSTSRSWQAIAGEAEKKKAAINKDCRQDSPHHRRHHISNPCAEKEYSLFKVVASFMFRRTVPQCQYCWQVRGAEGKSSGKLPA